MGNPLEERAGISSGGATSESRVCWIMCAESSQWTASVFSGEPRAIASTTRPLQ